ncbi:Syntaxin N-terminal domain [Trinorchestia longiramus]|nr:Syntaxin N-terminal domain [Trinorchestia longiramus]
MSGFGSNYQTGGGGGEVNRLQKYSHTIGSNIQKIAQNVKSMQQLVNQLGTEQDSPQLQAQLHKVQQYTNGLAKDTTAELRTFKSLPAPPGEEGRGWRMQQDRLTKQFTQTLNEFQATQRQAANKEKEALRKVRADSDSHYFDRGGSALVDIGGDSNSNQSGSGATGGQQLQQQLQQEEELRAIKERESQIRQLETDIGDVNQIFKDLATMVHEQGEVVDSIEANVENAQVNVSQGNVQLQGARHYQSKARRKKFILFLILAIVVAIIIGLIVWSSKK